MRLWLIMASHIAPVAVVGRASSSCSVYVHDPGKRFNVEAMSQPSQRWSQLDHSWHVAYWLHRALLRYARRVDKPADADVIFVAHYFLHENPSSDPLFFGPPLLEWHTALERGGPAGLFGNDSTLLQRWRQRSADFVVAPVLLACKHARGWLRAARWVIIDPFFDNACGYQHNFDIVAPYVPSDKWEARLPPEATTTTPNAFSRPRAHFALYAGRLGKAYLDYPRTLLRQRLWAVLRRHPNCTFWATDVPEAIAPFVSLPAERCGPRCSFGCHECLDMPPGADLATGSVRRIAPAAYRQLMRNATYCLVVRGDTHSTRKFSEAILAGCVPVLIADMPAWPFARRLRYDEFTFEFDWRLALRRPSAVLQALLRVTPAELEAKRRALQRVRRHFMYHDEPTTSGATRQLLADVCTAPRRSDRQRTLTDVYNRRPMHGRELMHEFQCAAADPSSSHASAVPACSPSPSAHQMPGAGDAFEHAPDDELTPPLANKAAVGGTTNASWVAGYCTAAEQTEYDCERGQKGSWSMPKTAIVSWQAAATACEQRCARCARCRFVSVSLQLADCTWAASCDLRRLRHTPAGFMTRALDDTGAVPAVQALAAPARTVRRGGRAGRGGRAAARAAKAINSPRSPRSARSLLRSARSLNLSTGPDGTAVADGGGTSDDAAEIGRPGFCAKTLESEVSNCASGDKGVLGPIRSWSSPEEVIDACKRLCRACARCRFVSVSLKWRDCSWAHRCPQLHTAPDSFRTFRVLRGGGGGGSRARRSEARRAMNGSDTLRRALYIPPPSESAGAGGSGGSDSGSGGGWAWLRPRAASRVAIVHFGKVGSLEQAASWVAADKGDPHVVRLAHASLRRHVLLANPHARCDVYLHSWNPSLKALIDRTYAPVWSAHEPERHGVGKVVSAMLSLRAALEAKRWRELHVLRAPYDLVLAARLDLVWYRPLVFSQLPRAQLWLAAQCCNVDEAYLDGLAVPARRSRSDANAAADGAAAAPSQHLRAGSSRSELERLVAVTRNECLGTDGDIEALCTTSRFLRMSGGDAAMAPEAEYNYYVNDWLFLAPSATADTFAALAQRHAAYVGALREVGIRVDYLHFHWSAHIHHALRVAAGVRPALLAGVEVHMARAAHIGRACRANRIVELPTVRAPVWGGMQHALCPTAGRVICPWASHHCAAHALEGVGVAYAR